MRRSVPGGKSGGWGGGGLSQAPFSSNLPPSLVFKSRMFVGSLGKQLKALHLMRKCDLTVCLSFLEGSM